MLKLGRNGPYISESKGLKGRPLKGPLGLYRGFMGLYKGCDKGYIGVILGIRIRGPFSGSLLLPVNKS